MTLPDKPDWDDREDWGLVMPFTEVVSEGGPYDDLAFVAGYQVGQIDGKLESRGMLVGTFLIYSRLAKQLDLIAMRHGYATEVLHDDGEWLQLGITRVD